MKKMTSVLAIASLLIGNFALAAGNGDVGSVNNPSTLDTNGAMERIFQNAQQIGGIDALTLLVDLAGARKVSLPGTSKSEMEKHAINRTSLVSSMNADLAAVKKEKSKDCFYAMADLGRNAQASGFASTMRVAVDVSSALFSPNEGMTLESLRSGTDSYASSLKEEVVRICR